MVLQTKPSNNTTHTLHYGKGFARLELISLFPQVISLISESPSYRRLPWKTTSQLPLVWPQVVSWQDKTLLWLNNKAAILQSFENSGRTGYVARHFVVVKVLLYPLIWLNRQAVLSEISKKPSAGEGRLSTFKKKSSVNNMEGEIINPKCGLLQLKQPW